MVQPYRSVIVPRLDYDLCRACRVCEPANHCPWKALVRIDREDAPYVAVERCHGCVDCARYCPFGAIDGP